MTRFTEFIGNFSNTTNTITLDDCLVRLGGQFYRKKALTINTLLSGIGGLDTGTIQIRTVYYMYIVKYINDIEIIASKNFYSPTGFSSYQKIGYFYTNSTSNVVDTFKLDENISFESPLGGSIIWYVPENVTSLFVTASGGGGGGGGGQGGPSGSGNSGAAGGAGGRGVTAHTISLSVMAGQPLTLNVGTGGTGGTRGTKGLVAGGAGGAGGTTTVIHNGVTYSFLGGTGGVGGPTSAGANTEVSGSPPITYIGAGSGSGQNTAGTAGSPPPSWFPGGTAGAGGARGFAAGNEQGGGGGGGGGAGTGSGGAGGAGGNGNQNAFDAFSALGLGAGGGGGGGGGGDNGGTLRGGLGGNGGNGFIRIVF